MLCLSAAFTNGFIIPKSDKITLFKVWKSSLLKTFTSLVVHMF